MAPLLSIEGLKVRYEQPSRATCARWTVSTWRSKPARPSPSSASRAAERRRPRYSILRLVEPGRIVGGRILFQGRDLLTLSEKEMRRVRGAGIGIAFQEPGAALNPVLKIGTQVGESLRIHKGLSRKAAWTEAVRLLEAVSLPDPERQAGVVRPRAVGGMKQRAMLAIALSCSPALLIADEPTSALDVTIQAQILDLLRKLKADYKLTVLLITHDFGVVAEVADRVGVMYAGRLVEEARTRRAVRRSEAPLHPGAPPRDARGRRRPPREAAARPSGKRARSRRTAAGCRFHPRCPEVFAPCATIEPELLALGGGRRVACHLHTTARG